jgi:EpsI family protein
MKPQAWAIAALMAASACVLHMRGDVDHVPASTPLAHLPHSLGQWTGVDIPIGDDVLAILGKGDFLERAYVPSAHTSGDLPVTLFIGYFPTQRTGQSIHSPQNCLPGAGWTFESSDRLAVRDGNGHTFRVGDYLISNGARKQELLYWYQSHGRSIASDYAAKLYMLRDSIVSGRTDAALVRITTSLQPGEDRAHARQRALDFMQTLTPELTTYIPD